MIYTCQKPAPVCPGCPKHPELPTVTTTTTTTLPESSKRGSCKDSLTVKRQQQRSFHKMVQLESAKERSSTRTSAKQALACLPCATPPPTLYADKDKLVNLSDKVYKNPCSSSLPIRRTPEERKRLANERDERLESEKEYAHSTWRMYHRIMCYRESHPLPACYFDMSTHMIHSDQSSPLSVDPRGSPPTNNIDEHDEAMLFDMDM